MMGGMIVIFVVVVGFLLLFLCIKNDHKNYLHLAPCIIIVFYLKLAKN